MASPRGPASLLIALALLAVSLMFVRARLEPPPALPVDAPQDRFSAGRARDLLADLIGDDHPHPVGSPAADRVRSKLLADFAALGIPAEIHHGFACSARGASCGRVGNVVARLPGREPGPAVLVSAHHDSVPAGPGAGDDGAGVAAVLELARALSLGPAPRNPVVFLLVDGEEAGLLGAQAFVDTHPLAAQIGVAVNLDAGGTRGVTSVTRTSPGNARVIDAFAAVVPRPYGASVIGAVYGLTPYDTDFSVYKKAELPSIDLGFGEDKAHYHTPLDRLDNLDPASLQHLGDTALALVRRLADDDLSTPHPGDRVFLDALGVTMLAWPALLTPLLALLALALLSLATWRLRHVPKDSTNTASPTTGPRPNSARSVTHADPSLPIPTTAPRPTARRWLTATTAPRWLAALAFPLLLAVPTLLASALAWLLATLTAAEVPGHADPRPTRLAIWAATLAASGLVATFLLRRLGPTRLNLAIWWSLAIVATALALAAPAAAVGVLPPVLLTAALLAWSSRHVSKDMPHWPDAPALLLALIVPALMWLQAGVRVEAIFGLGPIAVGVLALLFALLAPLWPTRPRVLLVALALASLTGAVLTLATPAFSEARPRRLSLAFHQDPEGARWLLDGELPLPPTLRAAADFSSTPAFPWTPSDEPSWIAPAPAISTPTPELTLETNTPTITGPWGRYLRLRLRSPRGARSAALVIPDTADLRWLAIAGHTVPPYPEHRKAWYEGVRHHPIVALPPEGVLIELVLRDPDPVTFTILDASEGLPPAADPLLRARPAWAIPSHAGDRTLLSRSVAY
ncbi:M20/M25/M40 family metallo-hydrolase [Nannocystis sp.]|uniref:M20/M25/M40 family metallo-hydrolase n=1 Tax=Nannocystis sp. TaxID=1962667 RepID=UPI0025E8AB9D|nr:M20/M25/M40 family metallo-hydrolase [Nannocystis sp.]MBK7825353.1 M20/M25/M40 family metallo-hydrolase [Nannocystis sp.]